MQNVIPLFANRNPATRDTPVATPATVGVTVDFSDIERIYSLGKDGKPVFSLDDPVVLGPRAQLQVRALFWRFALRNVPLTWGELEGNWNYCRMLNMWLVDMQQYADEESDLARVKARHNMRQPGRGDLLWLLRADDLDGAYAWHVANDTFRQNAVDPVLSPNKRPVLPGEGA
jgi:hypothetical protein